MFYVIETTYVGPNQDQDQYLDADHIKITTEPATANMSGEIRIEGWCGTTNDWSVHAHGEYETIEAARAAITEKFGDVREAEPDYEYDPSIVETYRRGKYAPLDEETASLWAYENCDVAADTTDEQIEQLAHQDELEANSDGFTLPSDYADMLRERRDEMRQEAEETDELKPTNRAAEEAILYSERNNTIAFHQEATNQRAARLFVDDLVEIGESRGLDVDWTDSNEGFEVWATHPNSDDTDDMVWRVHVVISQVEDQS